MMRAAFAGPIICPTFIGRQEHVATLQTLVERAQHGAGRLILLSGEAGIGKSRLLAATKAYATTQGFLVLQGNCFPADVTCPYAPLLDMLRALYAFPPETVPPTELEKLVLDLFPLLPELVPVPPLPRPALEPEQEKRRLFAVMTTFFSHLTMRQPLLLVLEDVHWSDDTSLDVLHSLARRCTSLPLLLLVSYRHDETRPPVSSWLAQMDRERLAHEIHLVLFSRIDVDTMLSAIFDQRHTSLDMRRFLHGELLDAIYTMTEGNPFFVEEILTSLIATGNIFYVQGYWNRTTLQDPYIPRSVQDAVQQRTTHLSQSAHAVLILAAVAGRYIDFTLLQQVTHYDEDHLLLLMKELHAAQLVVEESVERFAFRHALTREAIYKGLLARERKKLHCTLGEAIELAHASTLDRHLGELATHFYQGGVWQKAADYATQAGEQATRLYAPRAAVDYFTWAIDAHHQCSLVPEPTLYRTRGQAYDTLGEFTLAQHDYTQALETARLNADTSTTWHCLIDLGFLWAGRDYGQAETWFRQALDLAQSLQDPILHAHSLNRLGNWYLNGEQPLTALQYHQQALTIFQQQHNTHGIAETLDLLGMVSYLGGDLVQGTDYYRQAIVLLREIGDRQSLTSSLATLVLRGATYQTDTMLPAATSLHEVLQDAELALTIARESRQRSAEAYALFLAALCLGSQGEYMQALSTVRQSLHIAEEIEHRQWQTAARTVLGGLYSSMLAFPLARQHFEHALTLARETDSLFWTRMVTGYLASALLPLHALAEAERLLHTSVAAEPPRTMAQRMLACARTELALAQQQPERALSITDQLLAVAPPFSEGQCIPRVALLRGEALMALQRLEEAEAELQAAHTLASAHGIRPMQWHVYALLGKLYSRQGKHTEADQAFSAARALIETLATTIPDEEDLRDNFLRQAKTHLPRTRPLSPSRASKLAFGGLTAREREVAVLIAQGKSNREIADSLVVSERTIESHVSNILVKTGFASRSQIAAWTVEKGLMPSTDRNGKF